MPNDTEVDLALLRGSRGSLDVLKATHSFFVLARAPIAAPRALSGANKHLSMIVPGQRCRGKETFLCVPKARQSDVLSAAHLKAIGSRTTMVREKNTSE